MEMQQLRYFSSVARAESISKAARELDISQPALSKSIIKLETELGCKLFDRIGRHIRLNDKGRMFLSSVERSLDLLSDAVAAINSPGIEQAIVRIGIFGPQDAAAECVIRFMNAEPSAYVAVESNQPFGAGHGMRGFDALFYPARREFASIYGVPYARTRTMLCISSSHRFASRTSIDLEECANESFIFAGAPANSPIRCRDLCIKHGFEPHVRAIASNRAMLTRFVEANLGIAFVSACDAFAKTRSSLRIIPINQTESESTLMLACAPTNALSCVGRRFRDLALTTLGIEDRRRALSAFENN